MADLGNVDSWIWRSLAVADRVIANVGLVVFLQSPTNSLKW